MKASLVTRAGMPGGFSRKRRRAVMSMVGGVKGATRRVGRPLGVRCAEPTRIAPAAESTEEGRALRDARLGSSPPASAHGVLVAYRGERLVEEEEHGQHLAPEPAAAHRAYGATWAS